MQKADITKMVVTVEFSSKARNGRIVKAKFPVSLQGWIKMTPEEQNDYVAQHTKNTVINHDVI